MEIKLNGKIILTEYYFHNQIAKLLKLEEYYGNNLDALWDVLTIDVERPINLVWYNSTISRKNLSRETFKRIVKVLQDVQMWDKEMGWEQRFEFELL